MTLTIMAMQFHRTFILSLCLLCLISLPVKSDSDTALHSPGQAVYLPEWQTPDIPERIFDIRHFGAVGDGTTMNTHAINTTIDSCAKSGGGQVVIPEGIWLTGPVFLKSHIDLHLKEGAVLKFSKNFDDYPMVAAEFEGESQYRCTSPVNAIDLEHFAITGNGIIDGSGDAWRPVKRFKMTRRQWNALLLSGGVVNQDTTIWWPTQAAMDGENYLAGLIRRKAEITIENVLPARDFLRPVMIRLVNCRKVLLDGPTFQNSPAWNIHPLLCEDMMIRNITVLNPWFSQNGDGLDLESCRNIRVLNCSFDVGDDAICLKSGKNESGRRRGRPSENIIIRQCTVYHGHGGFTIGSEMSGGIRNILLTDCTFIGTDVGLRFKSTRGRGGVVENIDIRNIQMLNIPGEAILFDLFYEGNSDHSGPEPPVTVETPVFRDIRFSDILSIDSETAVKINGLPEKPLENVRFTGIRMTANQGVACRNGKNIGFSAFKLFAGTGALFNLNQCDDILIEPDEKGTENPMSVNVSGSKSRNIRVVSTGDSAAPLIKTGDGATEAAVQIIQSE